MRYLSVALILLFACSQPTNMAEQLASQPTPEERLQACSITSSEIHVFLRAFKSEEVLEVWASNGTDPYQLIQSYAFCVNSGTLGPKRREGDKQIPEGCYFIDRFNPNSKFHLSLGINYPNEVDLVHADAEHPGSDIFIHGGCASVGCISITDEKIEEVFALCQQARENGQSNIPVHIFPFKMSKDLLSQHLPCDEYVRFSPLWNQLSRVYAAFETHQTVPDVLLTSGEYNLK